MAKFEELELYYDNLRNAFAEKNETYYYNTDRSHNATVMRFMFDNASNINMYCGELSVLRNGFYQKINEDAGKLKDSMITSLHSFLEKGKSKLVVVLENFSEDIFNDLICADLFKEKMKENKISLYKLSDDFSFKKDINHFCYTDTNIVRFEEDKMRHNAICIFHSDSYIETMKNNFSILLNIAEKAEEN